jgi:hypothetical protein
MQKRIRRYLNIKRCRWWYFKVRADTRFYFRFKERAQKILLIFFGKSCIFGSFSKLKLIISPEE